MIDIQHLTKRFNHNTIFEDLNLSIDSGEVLGIIGPSGAGKSTLLRCLNLLEEPDQGLITIDKSVYDVKKDSKKQAHLFRQQTSMVFQQFNLFQQKTVLENVMEGLITVKKLDRNEAEKKATHYLQAVDLENRLNYYPQQLSGGQQQRVGIARGLAMESGVLLLDEPTSALDTELVAEVLNTIKKVILNNKNQTVIIVSHELAFIKDVATRVVFFDNGGIVETGTPDKLFNYPEKERTALFLSRFKHSLKGA
ncbi:amino acid ABC transporter ATP-binding protein [Agrilactobacillus yilanensis]|uniref:Amino acid ABC transporter ATP-binding protein n=1 Tax=Agrilactobacillus yilanensis TaxID=2485997 RepID=A0ABW4J474_9LACO|nr:amino acid ABC transporter ATP-binding protein [Agrilactobacillus yilanensis]